MNKIKMTSGKARKILYGFYNKDCYFDTPLYEAIPFILKENKDLQQRIDKAIEYIKECTSSPDEYENFISTSETKKLLEILGGKE